MSLVDIISGLRVNRSGLDALEEAPKPERASSARPNFLNTDSEDFRIRAGEKVSVGDRVKAVGQLFRATREIRRAEADLTAKIPSVQNVADAKSFVEAMDALDARRARLNEFAVALPRLAERAAAKYGMPNTTALPVEKLNDAQLSAILQVFQTFKNAQTVNVEDGVLGNGVSPLSARAMSTFISGIRNRYSSIDKAGAPNIEHLGSVFAGTLADVSHALGRPLTQKEVDGVAFWTLPTDLFGKGRSYEQLEGMRTAYTTQGDTVEDLDAQFQARAKMLFDAMGPVQSARVRALVESWIDTRFPPTTEDGVREAGAKAGLDAPEIDELVSLYKNRLVDTGISVMIQDWMRGIFLHGLPSFDMVQDLVRAYGKGIDAQKVYAAVLGHHVAGFITSGLGKADILPDFEAIERAGQIPAGMGKPLHDLFQSAEDLEVKWRPIVEQAVAKDGRLPDGLRQEFEAEAEQRRKAYDALPRYVQLEITKDDTEQLSANGVAKWLSMMTGATNEATLLATYVAGQQYYEENRALGTGDDFVKRSLSTANRLGMVFDEKDARFRFAEQKDGTVFADFARRITADDALRAEVLAEAKLPANLSADGTLKRLGPEGVIANFRGAPTSVAALTRLVHA